MNDIEAPWIGDPDYGHDDKWIMTSGIGSTERIGAKTKKRRGLNGIYKMDQHERTSA